MAQALTPAEKTVLGRAINRVAEYQAIIRDITRQAEELKEIIKATMAAAKLGGYETENAVAALTWPTRRQFDLALLQNLLDPEDFEIVAPRKVQAAKLDQLVAHHRYALGVAVKTKKAKKPTLEVRQVERT